MYQGKKVTLLAKREGPRIHFALKVRSGPSPEGATRVSRVAHVPGPRDSMSAAEQKALTGPRRWCRVLRLQEGVGSWVGKAPWLIEWGGGSSVESPHFQRVHYCQVRPFCELGD